MPISRIFTFAIAEAADQDLAVTTFRGLKDNCKKVCSRFISYATSAHHVRLGHCWSNEVE